MPIKCFCGLLLGCALLAGPVSAMGVGVSAKAGTLGLGADLTIGLCDYLGIRGTINGLTYNYNEAFDEANIDADLQLLTYGAILDWHVFGGGFRISIGALVNDNRIDLSADPNEPLELDGVSYDIASFTGTVAFDEIAPYVGFGYGNAAGDDGRWHFSCDFGVLYQGDPQVSAMAVAKNPVIQSALDAAVENERADIEDDISYGGWYPVIAVGVSFRF